MGLVEAGNQRSMAEAQPNHPLTISFVLSFIMIAERYPAAFAEAGQGKGD